MYKLNAHKKYSVWWIWLLAIGTAAACLLSHAVTAHAYGPTDCAGPRFGSDLGCTANDVSITNIAVVGGPASCTGGSSITVDLDVSVNFAVPNRWDIGIFISNDGKNPQLTPASGGAASCSVAILPLANPFLNLDGDGCGDGNGTIGGGTGTGVLHMTGVTINCRAISGSGGNLFIPFVVSWDNQASPSGATCNSIADPVPNTTSKCNAPLVAQGTVNVVVLPTITKTDNITTINPGDTTNYIVVITNTTGDTINNIVFKDPAVTYLTANSVSCTAGGGATCPASPTVAVMQGVGITIPSMPNNGSVTFIINATLNINAPAGTELTNTASVTVGSQTNSASDTDTINPVPVGVISISPSSSSKNAVSPASVVYNYTIYNRGASGDTITLSATSSQGWNALLSSTPTIYVNASSSATFTLTVQVPAGVTVGTIDTTTITAISGSNPSNTATATAVTTVSNPITITPNNTASGGKGSSAYYDHTVRNNTSTAQDVSLSITSFSGSCTGWTATIYKSDRITQITAPITLDPYGSSGDLDKDIVVKVNIPASAATGSVCTVTVRAEAGGNSASATDETTVKDLVLYSDSGYTNENNIFPAGSIVYAKAFGLATTGNKKYYFKWYDSSNTLKETSPSNNPDANKQLPDSYSIPTTSTCGVSGTVTCFGTWRVEVWLDETTDVKMLEINFYVGPDHISAGNNLYASRNTNVTITLSLHDRYNHTVPLDPSNNVVQGGQSMTVTVTGSAKITEYCNPSCTSLGAGVQSTTFNLDSLTGTATITINDPVKETVTVTPNSINLVGSTASPDRDESITVTFVRMKMKVIRWREVQ